MSEKTYELFLIDPVSMAYARRAAAKGFGDAKLSVTMIDHLLTSLHTEGPIECLCDDCKSLMRHQDNVSAFAVCVPMFPEPGSEGIAMAVCDACIERPDLRQKLNQAMTKLCPSYRLVSPARTRQ